MPHCCIPNKHRYQINISIIYYDNLVSFEGIKEKFCLYHHFCCFNVGPDIYGKDKGQKINWSLYLFLFLGQQDIKAFYLNDLCWFRREGDREEVVKQKKLEKQLKFFWLSLLWHDSVRESFVIFHDFWKMVVAWFLSFY